MNFCFTILSVLPSRDGGSVFFGANSNDSDCVEPSGKFENNVLFNVGETENGGEKNGTRLDGGPNGGIYSGTGGKS